MLWEKNCINDETNIYEARCRTSFCIFVIIYAPRPVKTENINTRCIGCYIHCLIDEHIPYDIPIYEFVFNELRKMTYTMGESFILEECMRKCEDIYYSVIGNIKKTIAQRLPLI